MTRPDPDPSHNLPASVDRTRVEMTQLVLPQFANSHGNVFGGQIMSWIDICAAVAAQRHARAKVVTASIDAVHFIAPVRQGHIVILRGQVNATFRTSMECGVSVWSEEPETGTIARAAKAYATFVALSDDGRPITIAPLVLRTDEDRRRDDDARQRREARLAMRQATIERAAQKAESLGLATPGAPTREPHG